MWRGSENGRDEHPVPIGVAVGRERDRDRTRKWQGRETTVWRG
jgi:hypothetical protein